MCLALPGRIIFLLNDATIFRSGIVDFGGIQKEINLAFVPEARINDYVLVHAGVALHTVKEQEAQQMRMALEDLE